MNYTNGFDIDLVLPALQKRLGWKQPTLAGSPVLNTANLTSVSKRYFSDFHALVTIANIKASQEDSNISDADFNAYLIDLQNSEIMRSLNEVFREPELIEQCLMYTRYGVNDIVIQNTGTWVGWLINVANDPSLATQINFATFYFDADVTFNMYLFQDGVREPLQTIEVNVVGWARTTVEFDIVLPFVTGAKYYFAYNQADLGNVHAIREQVETFAKTRAFEAFCFQAAPTTDGTYFNHNNKSYPYLPSGVNLEIITFRDHTQRILRKANLFDELQGLQMAAMIIEQVNMSTRTNLTERQTQQQSSSLDRDLNQAYPTNEVPVTSGLKSRILSEFKRVRNTFFPPQLPISTNMECAPGYGDAYENTWAQVNIAAANNPGAFIQS